MILFLLRHRDAERQVWDADTTMDAVEQRSTEPGENTDTNGRGRSAGRHLCKDTSYDPTGLRVLNRFSSDGEETLAVDESSEADGDDPATGVPQRCPVSEADDDYVPGVFYYVWIWGSYRRMMYACPEKYGFGYGQGRKLKTGPSHLPVESSQGPRRSGDGETTRTRSPKTEIP